MSTLAVSTADSVPEPRSEEGRPEAAERGRTEIRDRVIAKIARHSVEEIPETQDMSGRLGGLVDAGTAARVEVRRSGTHVTLRMAIAMRYPGPLRSAAKQVRSHVRGQVEHYTGLAVHDIDIEIAELVRTRRAR